jgi:hypothetical protein
VSRTWAVIWSGWLITFVFLFAIFEGYALATGGTTLSRYVWEFSAAWPPLPFFAGFLAGFLACHWWWGGIVPFVPIKK